MPRLTHKLTAVSFALFALACVCFAAFVSSPRALAQEKGERAGGAPAETPTPPSNSVIRGSAVFDDTNRPVRRARVFLINANAFGGQQRVTLTDSNGQFRLEGVSAGSYLVYVESPGVLTPASFSQYAAFTGQLDDLFKYFTEVDVDGKTDKDVEVRARLGGAVGGRVVYSDGTPAPGVTVNVIAQKGAGGALSVGRGSRTSAQTDERGRYRVSALAPGDYVVAASELIAHSGDALASGTASALIQTYHPSETKKEKAAVVSVGAGDEREDVDITIVERETHSIAGVVRGRHDGLPVSGARVTFSTKGGATDQQTNMAYAFVQNSTTTDEQGRWRFGELPDGDYTVGVTPPEERDYDEDEDEEGEDEKRAKPTPTPPKKNYAPGSASVSVAGGDVNDIVVTLGQAARIAGTMSVAGGKPLPQTKVIYARQVETNAAQTGIAEVSDAEFKIEGLAPGKYVLQVQTEMPALMGMSAGGESDLYVKSVTWRGRDLTREPIELKEGEPVEGVSIVFAQGRARLRLRAYGAGPDKPPARGIYVFLMSANRSRPYESDLPFCITDKDGSCSLSGPPGEYAVVGSRGAGFFMADEAEVERRIVNAPRVTLRTGESAAFELTLPAGN